MKPADPKTDPAHLPTPFWPLIAILVAIFLWGASFSAMRAALRELGPWEVMAIRMLLATIAVTPFVSRLGPNDWRREDIKWLAIMVICQPCLYFWFEANALRFTTSSQAGLITAVLPLLVACGAWLFLSETLLPRTLIGAVASLLGVLGLTLAGGGDGAVGENPLLGNGLELLAMASDVGNFLIVKKLSRRYHPWMLTALQVFAGAVFFSPGLYQLYHNDHTRWTWQLAAIMLFLGVLVSLCAFGFYNWGLSRIPAVRASIFINLVPVLAVLFGWLLLDEGLGPVQSCCALAVIGGVWYGQKR